MAFVVLAACGDDEPTNNGVNDVKKACELKTTWKRARDLKCINCVSAAPNAKCDCEEIKEFSGACSEQGDLFKSACPQNVIDCALHCPVNDCACVENCYNANGDCKKRAAMRDGCVVDRCDEYCQ